MSKSIFLRFYHVLMAYNLALITQTNSDVMCIVNGSVIFFIKKCLLHFSSQKYEQFSPPSKDFLVNYTIREISMCRSEQP